MKGVGFPFLHAVFDCWIRLVFRILFTDFLFLRRPTKCFTHEIAINHD